MVKTTKPSASGEAGADLRETKRAGPPARSSLPAQLLHLAENACTMGHWYADLATGTVSWSAQVFRIFGVDEATFTPDLHAILSVCHPDDRARVEQTIKDAIAGKGDFEFDCRIARPDGTWRTIVSTGRAETDAAGNVVALFGLVIDVTQALRRSEDELQRRTFELEQLNLQKDKLFSIIAHDLRSPFNSIIGFSDLLVSNARDLSHGQTVSYAQIVRESAIGVHNLLDNLLAWASFQIRDGALKLEPLNMAAVAVASLEPLAYMAETKGVTISNGIGDVTALGDEALVRIVIRNLVSNGIKFSRNGGVVQLTAAPLLELGKSMIRVSVRDDGIGMSGAILENLFTLDRTASAPGTRGERGTGLGLFLCRDVIARHGGTVSVESTPGAGTTFHFTLPSGL